jgi:hypothetical protein
MQNDLELLRERLAHLETRCARSERRLRALAGLGVASLVVALFASPATRAVAQSGYGATIQALIDKTQYITCAGGEMYIRNTNLHLENGLGATNGYPADPNSLAAAVTNGKGNLIVGYNASRTFDRPNVRTGSHNLILGDGNNYSSFGGLVAGRVSTTSAPYASVSGGEGNTASDYASSVSGGNSNTAAGYSSSVSGGNSNTATGYSSGVSGGLSNTASSFFASVSGGDSNTALGDSSSVSGGRLNTASGIGSSVSGGIGHHQAGNGIWQGGTLSSGP